MSVDKEVDRGTVTLMMRDNAYAFLHRSMLVNKTTRMLVSLVKDIWS